MRADLHATRTRRPDCRRRASAAQGRGKRPRRAAGRAERACYAQDSVASKSAKAEVDCNPSSRARAPQPSRPPHPLARGVIAPRTDLRSQAPAAPRVHRGLPSQARTMAGLAPLRSLQRRWVRRPPARTYVCMHARPRGTRRRRARRAARRFAASLLANTAGTRGRWWARPLPTALARPLACSRASRRAKWRRSTRPRESWRGPRVHTARLAQNVPPPFLPLLWLAPSPRRRHPCCPSFLRHRCRGCSMSRARTPTWTTRTSPPSTARCLPPSEGS